MNSSKRTRDLLLRSTYLDVDSIVAELRSLRLASLESRNRHDRPPRLPSRKILASVAEGLSAAMFPNRLGSAELADEGIDHYVGHILNMTLRELMVQIQHELHYNSGLEILSDEDRAQSVAITQAFAKSLPEIRRLLESDIKAAYEGDPAARNVDEVLVCYPGIMAITHYRLAHVLHGLGVPLIARMISEIAHSATGIEIHPGAQISGAPLIMVPGRDR